MLALKGGAASSRRYAPSRQAVMTLSTVCGVGRGQEPAAWPKGRNRSKAVARIAGVNIPTNKRVVVALQYIHGIGPHRAHEIVEKVGIPAPRRVSQLT